MGKLVEGLGIAGLFAGGLLLVLLGIGLQLAYGVLIVFMFIWNISDIQNVGANGWNIAWLVLASIMALGFIASIFNRN